MDFQISRNKKCAVKARVPERAHCLALPLDEATENNGQRKRVRGKEEAGPWRETDEGAPPLTNAGQSSAVLTGRLPDHWETVTLFLSSFL